MSNEARLLSVICRNLACFLPNISETNKITLGMMITGLLLGENVQLKEIVKNVYYTQKATSLEERFRRFLRNDNLEVQTLFNPFIVAILASLAKVPLVIIMDSTKVGGRCIGLMVSVMYKSRALPLCWLVYKGRKGHSNVDIQLQLLALLKETLGERQEKLIFLGDGEFDNGEVIEWLKEQGWLFACRVAQHQKIEHQTTWMPLKGIPITNEEERFLRNCVFTEAKQVEDVNIAFLWHKKKKEHWVLVTNLETLETVKEWYKKRFLIETLFSDLKGRGFNLQKTRIWKPERVERLLLVVAIAYLFDIFLGVTLILTGPLEQIVRTDRFFHSLFQLGRHYLTYLLKNCLCIPYFQTLPSPTDFEHIVLVE